MTTPLTTPVASLLRSACVGLHHYRDQVLLIGGLVPFIYQYIPTYRPSSLLPIATMDVDIAVPLPLEKHSTGSVTEHLTAQGLISDLGRGCDGEIALQRFYPPGPRRDDSPYLEFLVRDQRRGATPRPQPDLVAQPGDFLELLTDLSPVAVEVPEIGRLCVPHPLGYIAQKTRMRSKRKSKWSKDQADVVQVVWAFQSEWQEWAQAWRQLGLSSPQGVWLRTVHQEWTTLYRSPHSDGPRAVAEFYNQRTLVTVDAENIFIIMRDFLRMIPASAAP